jgi:hypothetical protein
MRSPVTLKKVIIVIALTLTVEFLARPARAQSSCIDACAAAYANCEGSGSGPNCDDIYNNCVDGCLLSRP